eukprot:gene24820-10470_t
MQTINYRAGLQHASMRVQPRRVNLCQVSKFDTVTLAPPDPILGVSEAFRASTSPNKLNLGVGAYRDEDLKPYVLPVVAKAEKMIVEAKENKEYLPIEGFAPFRKATVDLLLGNDHPAIAEGRIAALQSLSGTGSLRVGAAFIANWMKGTTVYLSNPTWGNHRNIFGDEGVKWEYYRYYDAETVGLDFKGMIEDISNAPDASVIVLHGCAHNPTGIDPTKEQWAEIAELCIKKNHVPFFDVAYQGFASGDLNTDAYAPRLFVEKGLEIMVSQSYSKNLGLYGERVGALVSVCKDKDTATKVLSQCKRLARALYSNPPTHGARIAAEVVNTPELFAQWKTEMAGMAGRIDNVRNELKASLDSKYPEKDWSHITNQIGMFSFTGLSPAQVEYLADAMVESFKNA